MPRKLIVLVAPAVAAFALAAVTSAKASCPALPYQLTNGQTADASQVMADLNALLTCLNAGSASPGGSTNAVQYNAGNGSLGGIGPLTNGQLLIGVTGSVPQAAALTAGNGIAITNGSGGITIGATGTGLYGGLLSATPTSSGTGLTNWVNQGAASVTDTPVGVSIVSPGQSSNNYRLRTLTSAPQTPYSYKALVSLTAPFTHYQSVGIGWYDGNSKFQVIALNQSQGTGLEIDVGSYDSPSNYNSNQAATSFTNFPPIVWLQIKDDGTSVSFGYSIDGVNFITLYSVAKASGFLGSAGYARPMFAASPLGGDVYATLMSWNQGP